MTEVSSPSAAYATVLKNAWSDPSYRAKLISDPAAGLAAAGVPVPPGVKVKVVEDTNYVMHLVLPPHAEEGELEEESLDLVAGGVMHLSQNVMTAAMRS